MNMKPSERGRRHQIAKLRLQVKELRRALLRMEAHIRMQDEKIALLARRASEAAAAASAATSASSSSTAYWRNQSMRVRWYWHWFKYRQLPVTFHLSRDYRVDWSAVCGVQVGGWFVGAVRSHDVPDVAASSESCSRCLQDVCECRHFE
jgi:hypothetical protein